MYSSKKKKKSIRLMRFNHLGFIILFFDTLIVGVGNFELLNVSVRTKKSSGPNSLRTVSYIVKLWPKSIEFVREGNK